MPRRAFLHLILTGICACGGGGTSPIDGGGDALLQDGAPLDSGDASVTVVDAGAIPRFTLDLGSTSVSGISSGGFMAVQFHLAFSSMTKGAAIFAAGPYMCSKGSVSTALTSCAQGSPAPDVPSLVTLTNQNAQSGAIDNPSALSSQRVFLFGGADDVVVSPTVVDALQTYYASFMPSGSIQYVNRRSGTSHTWPTLTYGNPCDVVASPYLGACNYDGAGQALAQIYGTLSPAATSPGGAIIAIPQGAFVADPGAHSLDDTAYVYAPAACTAGETCKLHIAFHGCLQGASLVGDAFYAHSGLNEWADTNHIVVLYPQVTKSASNPQGCWDWWGYDSPDFAKKTGPQIAMVRAMMDGLKK